MASQPVVGLDQAFGRWRRSSEENKKKLDQKMEKTKKDNSSKRDQLARNLDQEALRKPKTRKISRKEKSLRKKEVESKSLRKEEEKSKSLRKKERKSLRKEQRSEKRKSSKKNKRKSKRKKKRKISGEKKSGRKERRKRKRKQKRAKLRKIEDSRLGKPIPKEKMEIFRENFQRGKERVGISKQDKFLKIVDNPFEGGGRLRSDFRQLVREKVSIISKTNFHVFFLHIFVSGHPEAS